MMSPSTDAADAIEANIIDSETPPVTQPHRIYRAGTGVREKLNVLGAAIIHRPPYCSGTLTVDPEELVLFYGRPTKDEKIAAGRIDFSRTTEEDLQRLADVCEPATFGLGQQDVLDLTYRTALKLDKSFFEPKLDVNRAGLIDLIRYSLLEGKEGSRYVVAELYKLNVYGKGSFFKTHKDTPRDESMFGSLVIVLPSVHEGGELVLRHGGQEWTFNSAKATKDAQGPSIGYAAFFSDVEHEVRMVTSGYRVTLTYNLYFADPGRSYVVSRFTSAVPAAAPGVADAFKSTLSTLLADTSFLPNGGYLGFGMRHEYPINTATRYIHNERNWYDMRPDRPEEGVDALARLGEMLKGSDAAVADTCRALGLTVTLNVVHTTEDYDLSVMFDGVPDFEGMNTQFGFTERWLSNKHNPRVIATSSEKFAEACQAPLEAVRKVFDEGRKRLIEAGAENNDTYHFGEYSRRNEKEAEQKAIEKLMLELDEDEIDMDENYEDDPKLDVYVHWVTPSTPFNAFKSNIIAYGNEADTDCLYGRVCLIVEMGPPEDRGGKASPVVARSDRA